MSDETAARMKPYAMWFMILVIAAACLLAYYPVINTGFVSDDYLILYNIKHHTIAEIGGDKFFFRPLVLLSFALDSHIFGDWSPGFHLVNLLLHFAASIGVALSAILLCRRTIAGYIAGLIFALHPVHPEAISWIAGRYDVFCGALISWSLYSYLLANEPDARRPRILRSVSVILFGLACLAKEMAFAFPMVILLYEFLMAGSYNQTGIRSIIRLKRLLPFFIVAVLLFTLRWLRLEGIGGYGKPEFIPPVGMTYRILMQPIKLLLIPVNRTLFDPSGIGPTVLIKLVMLAPLALLPFTSRWRLIGFCLASIIISMLPTAHLGILEWRLESSRFLYIPSIFFSFFIASIFVNAHVFNWRKSAANILMIVYLITLLFCVNQNNYPWRDAADLVRTAISSTNGLVEKYNGQWGTGKRKLVVFNVPGTYLGAAAFINAVPPMLKLRYGKQMENVEFDVIYSGVQTKESLDKVLMTKASGQVVWVYDDKTRTFMELEIK